MTINVSHSFITVDDQDKALTFYRDALGLEVKADAPLGPYRWLTVGSPDQPGVEIVLATPDMGHGPDDTEALKALLAKGALQAVIFTTDDFDAMYERVRASGAERPGLRGAGLRVPRPLGQPGPDRDADSAPLLSGTACHPDGCGGDRVPGHPRLALPRQWPAPASRSPSRPVPSAWATCRWT